MSTKQQNIHQIKTPLRQKLQAVTNRCAIIEAEMNALQVFLATQAYKQPGNTLVVSSAEAKALPRDGAFNIKEITDDKSGEILSVEITFKSQSKVLTKDGETEADIMEKASEIIGNYNK